MATFLTDELATVLLGLVLDGQKMQWAMTVKVCCSYYKTSLLHY